MYLSVTTRRPEAARDAPPLVFVHGICQASWCWEEHFLPWFAERGFEVHALDLRGHGASDSDRSLRRLRIDHHVADVDAVVRALERPPVLIGHSMGGLVVQRYLEDHRLPGAVLIAPVPVGGVRGATLRTLRRHPLVFARLTLGLHLWPLVRTPDLAREHMFTPDADPAETDRHIARLEDDSYLTFLDMLAFRRPRPDRIDTPVMIIAGERDGLFTLDEMMRTAEAYGEAPVVIPGAGHEVMLDPGWELAAGAMLRWLEDLPVT